MQTKIVWILLLVGLTQCCAAEEAAEEAAGVIESHEKIDLFSPETVEDEEEATKLIGSNEPINFNSSQNVQSGSEKTSVAQTKWQEPKNAMSIVRLFYGLYYESQYSIINEMLIKEVESNLLGPNMEKILEWYERERKRGINLLLNRATYEALGQLIEFYYVVQKGRCDRVGYEAAFKNDKATRGRAHVSLGVFKPLRRIDMVVHKLMLMHTYKCFKQYPETFNNIRFKVMNQEKRKIVETFMDAIIADPYAVKSNVNNIRGKKAAELAFKTIRRHGDRDPNLRFLGRVVDERSGKLFISFDGIRALVQKYLVEPCEEFVGALGPDVFFPARFNAKMLGREDRYVADSRLNAEFVHGWIQFRLCQRLIETDEPALTKQLVQYVNEMIRSGKFN